mgnify:CR=1 FL=1
MSNRLFTLFVCIICACCSVSAQKKLIGNYDSYVSSDSAFQKPYIDKDEMRTVPAPHRYIHGGFSNGTKFSLYFPTKEQYKGHFFQYITPFPDSENIMQNMVGEINYMGSAITNGAYFIETNGGGRTDFSNMKRFNNDPTIGAYRAHAACAQFSRLIASKVYNTTKRPYGYAFGGSGGAYRTVGCSESTQGVWDGFVPFVLGSPMAIPNVFCVRMHAMRLLHNKLPQIVDAVEPGGSGDMYAGLNDEEKAALTEVTKMGFPPKAWYGYKDMGIHGFLVLYQGVVAADKSYFENDFWNKPGYLGYNAPESLRKARLQKKSTITALINSAKGVQLGLTEPIAENERGSADKAWKSMGGAGEEMPVAYQLNDEMPDVDFLGGDLIILSGKAKGASLQITKVEGDKVVLAPTNPTATLVKIMPGDSVQVDNSNFLAVQTYHRHQVPSKDFYVWDQFRDNNGDPLYPQRPMLLGPIFTQSAAGCVPTGKIHGKMIVLCSMMDREAFPWQGDWYRYKVREHLGDKADANFRLWYTEHAIHGFTDDSTHAVSYEGELEQALLDMSDWVEKGIEPAKTTNYLIQDGQIVVPAKADDRKGIQPVVNATIKGSKRADIQTGDKVTFHVTVDIPQGKGKLVFAKWNFDGSKSYTKYVDLTKAKVTNNGCHIEFDTTQAFTKAGTFFPTVMVAAQRKGNTQTPYTRVYNLDRTRVVVK